MPPTPKALQLKKLLYIMLIAHLIFAIMIMVFDIYAGFTELINVMILLCATMQMHFCLIIFYIILSTFAMVNSLCDIGLLVQDNLFSECYKVGVRFFNGNMCGYALTVTMMFVVFLVIDIAVCFKAYKECKGMLYDH